MFSVTIHYKNIWFLISRSFRALWDDEHVSSQGVAFFSQGVALR